MPTNEQILPVLRLEGCSPSSLKQISEVEAHIGVRFPETLKQIWLIEDEPTIIANRTSSEPSRYTLYSIGEPNFQYVSVSLKDAFDQNIWELPHNCIAIGGQSNGDMLVLDYRSSDSPSVVKFYHEQQVGNHDEMFGLLGTNFDDFIDRVVSEKL